MAALKAGAFQVYFTSLSCKELESILNCVCMIYDSNNVFKKQIKLSCQDGTGGLAVAIAFDIWSSDQLFIYIIHKSRRHLSFFGLTENFATSLWRLHNFPHQR